MRCIEGPAGKVVVAARGRRSFAYSQALIPNSIDKGIFITSSDFTAQARSTARASDKKPIELISGSDIVRLLEERILGLRQVYDIDQRFFDDFEFEVDVSHV